MAFRRLFVFVPLLGASLASWAEPLPEPEIEEPGRFEMFESALFSIHEHIVDEYEVSLIEGVEEYETGMLKLEVTEAWGALPREEQRQVMSSVLTLWASHQEEVRRVGLAVISPDGTELAHVLMEP